MIGYLNGKLLDSFGGTALLEVGGVGYEVVCSSSAFSRLVKDGGGAIFTYTAVREDGIYLYGFDTKEEKNMFLKLISVSGIGPKMGITVLSGINLQGLALAIASSDVKTLSKIKGLGKKTAERLILELREKVSSLDMPENTAAESAPTTGGEEANEDAVIALMAYGYNRAESVKAVKAAVLNGATTIEQILLYAIRGM